MKNNQTPVKQNDLETGIENLNNEITRMKSVLPFIRQTGTRTAVGTSIRHHQQTIQMMKRELFNGRN